MKKITDTIEIVSSKEYAAYIRRAGARIQFCEISYPGHFIIEGIVRNNKPILVSSKSASWLIDKFSNTLKKIENAVQNK